MIVIRRHIAGPHCNKDGCEDEDEEAIMVNVYYLLASKLFTEMKCYSSRTVTAAQHFL